MAKKTKEVEFEDDYLSADYVMERNKIIIPTSIALDPHLGGGIPEGSVVVISGPEKLGKTSLALKIMANAQKLGRIGVYANIEHRLKRMNLTGIKGLDISKEAFKLITSSENNILTAEQILEKCAKALNDFPGCVLILDSLSALCSAQQSTGGYGEGFGLQARKLEAEFFKRIPPVLSVNGNIVIGISHVMPNIGPYGGKTEKMSGYTKYAQDVKLEISKYFKKGGDKFEWMSGARQVGHRVMWYVANSALSSPGGECTGYIRYGVGLDDVAEMVSLASELDIIQKGGAGWFTFPNGDKAQGFDNAYEYLMGNLEEFECVNKKVRELLL